MKNSHLVGKVEEFVTVLNANVKVLTEAGVVVKDIAADLTERKDSVVTKTAARDGLQTAAKDSTVEVNEATTALYDAFSSKIDHVAGAVGKKSNLAKQIKKLRTGLQGKGGNSGSKAVTPKLVETHQPSADATFLKAA